MRRGAAGLSKTLKVFDLPLTCRWIREGSERREPLGGSWCGLDTSQVEVLPADKQDDYLSRCEFHSCPLPTSHFVLVYVGTR